jgi:hypothetical protein
MTTTDTIVLSQSIVMLLTLFVLIWQIRVFINTSRTAQYQAALQMLFDWRSDIIRDEELAKRYETSTYFQEVFEDQPPKEYFHTLKLFQTLEVLFLLQHHGVINQQMGIVWRRQAEVIFTPKPNRILWVKLKAVSIYNTDFTSAVDSIVAEINNRVAHGASHEEFRAQNSGEKCADSLPASTSKKR